MQASGKSQPLGLPDEVRQVLRLHHYSIPIGLAYVEWVIQFAHLDRVGFRQDLFPFLFPLVLPRPRAARLMKAELHTFWALRGLV
jgi:hypothetical protein